MQFTFETAFNDMDFYADFKRIVEKRLQDLGVKFSADDNWEKLMLLVLNHARKTIRACPRQVYSSTEFNEKKSKLDEPMQSAADVILKKLKEGEDVSAHLSKDSANPAKPDDLLSVWRIHHFHISNHKEKPTDTFYERTGPLMFAFVTDDAGYFIDIYPHGTGPNGEKYPDAWTHQDLIGIVEKEWPQLLDSYRFDDEKGFELSDLKLAEYRKMKINCSVPVGNSVVFPGGLMMNRTPLEDHFEVMRKKRDIDELIKWANNHAVQLRAQFSKRKGLPESCFDFELVRRPYGFMVIEKRTQAPVYIYRE